MTPAKYLKHKENKIALEYFKQMAAILKERGDDDESFSFELSQLANEFGKYHKGADTQNERGMTVVAKSGWEQNGPWIDIQNKAISNIGKLSPKFGFTPSDLEKLGKRVVEQEEVKSDLEKMIG